ncbi:hypothetical protein, variant [Saprolegnia diclina VS20]|uniref:Kinesin motor domain-containing protein n=1 Tax=Saprolegnia diclina (strain VS20) TaxID=1156394 RepID=T0R7D2_SAPDV|nr:hypothetical protein, variant [Saprolegnia diclina VS20]EQC42370.1 hypothetical protein, variant [Saprolegnia diclina VS20]|eukprot:XP_008603793.1 hypothetical protein, variant [Saprolegnia diclina VS20]
MADALPTETTPMGRRASYSPSHVLSPARRHRRSMSTDSSDSGVLDAPSSADNIRAFVRIQPTTDDAPSCVEVAVDATVLSVSKANGSDVKAFTVDGVVQASASQADVYEAVGAAFVAHALAGYNGCLFAYGQTGSGKTYTMEGESTHGETRGVVPRILEALFAQLSAPFECRCSYLEIYNERIYDLLDDDVTVDAKLLREDSQQNVFVQDLLELPVTSSSSALQLLALGGRNRTVGSTAMNRESSRSHSVFTIKLTQTTRDGARLKSILHLVDLAGSEKQSQTGATGVRLKEINKSLSVLGNVITALVDVSSGRRRHVHYRDSKLTFLLRDALGGNSKTTVVATISAHERWLPETVSTLQFVQRVKYIKNHAVQFEDDAALIARLEKQVAALTARLDDRVDEPEKDVEPPAVVAAYEEQIADLERQLADATKDSRWIEDLHKLKREVAAKEAIITAKDKEIYAIKDTLGKIVQDTEIILEERNALLVQAAAFEAQKRAMDAELAKVARALMEAQDALDGREKASFTLQEIIADLQTQLEHKTKPRRMSLRRLFSTRKPDKLANII